MLLFQEWNQKMSAKLRYLFIVLLLSVIQPLLKAQDNELSLGLRAGNNAALGNFAAVSLEAAQTLGKDFSLNAGVQYSTLPRTALEMRPAYSRDFNWGKLSPELLLSYTRLESINNFALGFGAGVDMERISARLGYYYRLYGGHGGRITEPFNVYYELCLHFLKKIQKWNLDLLISNCEIFELERHYQPSFIAEVSYYPGARIGLMLGLGCKPSGMFHISADYYQSFLKTGICCRW